MVSGSGEKEIISEIFALKKDLRQLRRVGLGAIGKFTKLGWKIIERI